LGSNHTAVCKHETKVPKEKIASSGQVFRVLESLTPRNSPAVAIKRSRLANVLNLSRNVEVLIHFKGGYDYTYILKVGTVATENRLPSNCRVSNPNFDTVKKEVSLPHS
jgi:hypothetical protein